MVICEVRKKKRKKEGVRERGRKGEKKKKMAVITNI